MTKDYRAFIWVFKKNSLYMLGDLNCGKPFEFKTWSKGKSEVFETRDIECIWQMRWRNSIAQRPICFSKLLRI